MLTKKLITKNTMLNEKKLTYLRKATKYVINKKIEGDIVECGVWNGGSVALIANILKKAHVYKTLSLFDSFDDPHEPLPIDGDFLINKLGGKTAAKGRLKPNKGFYKKITHGRGPGDEKYVYKLLTSIVGYPKEKVNIYKGWFQETLIRDSMNVNKISLLIIDCDFYIPTKLSLKYLYDKVVIGGIIVIDDYPTLEGCKVAVDEYIYSKRNINVKQVNDTGCIYWHKKI